MGSVRSREPEVVTASGPEPQETSGPHAPGGVRALASDGDGDQGALMG
jgi:hypothetical protein